VCNPIDIPLLSLLISYFERGIMFLRVQELCFISKAKQFISCRYRNLGYCLLYLAYYVCGISVITFVVQFGVAIYRRPRRAIGSWLSFFSRTSEEIAQIQLRERERKRGAGNFTAPRRNDKLKLL
jgi:hypothetical protein